MAKKKMAKKNHTGRDIRIVIQQAGFVSLGEYARAGLYARVKRGCHVRRYGGVGEGQITDSRGLGKLARKGPSEDSILDWKPPSEHHLLVEVETILCDPQIWGPIIDEHGIAFDGDERLVGGPDA